ncbi:MAG: hypothetical protein JXR58_00500 [Bacteroidales bacterium]|nr:hypothetical protein [Bacteroidales bacterium]
MEFFEINSNSDLKNKLETNKRSFLLLYKSGSQASECAVENLKKLKINNDSIEFFAADVTKVRDIHENYNISTVPALLEFEGYQVKNTTKGCHDTLFFQSLLDDAVYKAKAQKEGKTIKTVIAYTSQTCTWCNTLKSYLKQHGIRYREVDISKNQKAAEDLVKRSGQRGVPQTEINGKIVVGFDKLQLNRLLEIKE